MLELQLTHAPRGHILTNIAVWSPDSKWIVYDTRSDATGERFDGSTIESVNVETGEVKLLYRSQRGAHCGVATVNPVDGRVVFILGPEDPSPDWKYGPYHRQGVIVDPALPGVKKNMDARDITPPFASGALRGGSHVHVFSPDGQWVSFTYEDHVLAQLNDDGEAGYDVNQRNIGISVPGITVQPKAGPRNHGGDFFSVQVTRTTAHPRPGSDEISRAFEEGWVAEGLHRAVAFQGNVVTPSGQTIAEAFVVDLPVDVTIPGDGPLQGTKTRAPAPPRGTMQRRLTYTADRKFPGIQGPRHWLRSSPDGTKIGLLMKDDAGIVQLWTVSPTGGPPVQVTHNAQQIASSFTWSPDGRRVAHVMGHRVCVTKIQTGETRPLTSPTPNLAAPRPQACVFSPDGKRIAYVKPVQTDGGVWWNQVFVVDARE